MNRGIIIVSVLAAAAAAAVISVRACAGGTQAAAANPGPAAVVSQWQVGVNYDVLARPQPPQLAPGKVEVNEVFWYGCGHCYALDPTLENWKSSKPGFIEFVRIPVMWGPYHRQHAKLFYTLQALGRTDLHSKVFDAIHRDGLPLAASTDAEARTMHRTFLEKNGVSEKQFNDAYDSAEVERNLEFAQEITGRFQVASVPTMIIDGTYSTSVSQAGGPAQLIALVNDLAAREKRR